ncbi:MAG: hypothetical protein KAU21_03060 [Gammaproteobacteria bacterium]|nr:hypothetical protein [Gammaproteobacteria bacterium]
MITKILFTLTVIVGVILFFRTKRAQPQQQKRSPQVKKELSENEKMFRQGAYLFMLFMVISALAVFFFEIGDNYATVKVHVVNTQTGHKQTYKATQKDIKSNSFKTLEGRTVYIADIERIEIEPED